MSYTYDTYGSITQVVDTTGMVVQELSYDAWGCLRDPVTQQPYAPGESPSLLLGRGYCGHEHLPEFNLLNMNAHVATMLSHIIPVSVYNGQQEFANNMVMDKYGTYEQGSRFSEGKRISFFY